MMHGAYSVKLYKSEYIRSIAKPKAIIFGKMTYNFSPFVQKQTGSHFLRFRGIAAL